MMKALLSAILMSCTLLCGAQDSFNCYAIIAGRDATSDGSVILGHNEDDTGEQMFNAYFTLPRDIDQKKQYGRKATGYFWAEFPGMPTADAFMNDNGVAVVSDNCKSREDSPELVDGGVLYEVRVNVARYARSAREAVDIIGNLVSTYGYAESGRTYIVADSREAWLVAVVHGRHWAAARVPDNGVVIIPNYYVIDRVDLADTANYAASDDIISYAVERGWYNPEKDGEFSFRNAYANDRSRVKPFNVERHIDGFKALGIETSDPFNRPFSFVPENKISVTDIMTALSSHRRGYAVGSLSRNSTVLSTVFQMRPYLPKAIGCVCFLAVGHPGVEPFFPVYLGMSHMPKGLARYGDNYVKAEKKHFTDCAGMRERYPACSWWKHLDRWDAIYKNPDSLEFQATAKAAMLQDEIFSAQAAFEREMIEKHTPSRFHGYKDFHLADDLNRNFEEYYAKWLFNF